MPELNLISERNSLLEGDHQSIQENRDLISRSTRNRREQNSLHWCFLVILWMIVSGFGLAIFTKMVTMILPDRLCWLNEDQLKKLNDFIINGGIGGVGMTLFKNKNASTNN